MNPVTNPVPIVFSSQLRRRLHTSSGHLHERDWPISELHNRSGTFKSSCKCSCHLKFSVQYQYQYQQLQTFGCDDDQLL